LDQQISFPERNSERSNPIGTGCVSMGKGMYFFRLSYNKNTVAGEKVVIE